MLDSSASLEHSFSNDDINVAMYLTTVFFGSFSIVLMNNNGLNLSRVREQQSSPGCSQQWAGGRGDPSTVTLIGAAAALSSVTERKLFFAETRKPGKTDRSDDGEHAARKSPAGARVCATPVTHSGARERRREKERENLLPLDLSDAFFPYFLVKKNKNKQTLKWAQ